MGAFVCVCLIVATHLKGFVIPWVAGNEVIVENINVNIPVSL